MKIRPTTTTWRESYGEDASIAVVAMYSAGFWFVLGYEIWKAW